MIIFGNGESKFYVWKKKGGVLRLRRARMIPLRQQRVARNPEMLHLPPASGNTSCPLNVHGGPALLGAVANMAALLGWPMLGQHVAQGGRPPRTGLVKMLLDAPDPVAVPPAIAAGPRVDAAGSTAAGMPQGAPLLGLMEAAPQAGLPALPALMDGPCPEQAPLLPNQDEGMAAATSLSDELDEKGNTNALEAASDALRKARQEDNGKPKESKAAGPPQKKPAAKPMKSCASGAGGIKRPAKAEHGSAAPKKKPAFSVTQKAANSCLLAAETAPKRQAAPKGKGPKRQAALKLGCKRCRGSRNGCAQCRNPKYSGPRLSRDEWVRVAAKENLK